jgi:predicted metal-dependent phosphoesterase TrpH
MNHESRRYAVDFHVHTAYSFDSVTPPKVVIEMARRRGLDAIAITDHDTFKGAIATVEANKYSDFLVIPGIEVKSDLGDIIGLFLKGDIVSRRFGDVIDEIHAQGGVAYVPHPIRTFGADMMPQIQAAYPQIDRWERYNGRYDATEFAQADDAFEALAIRGSLCGSDAHAAWEVGLFRTLFTDLPRDAASLLALSANAELVAAPRGELALRAGITLGTVTKTFKRGQYAKFGKLLASLPYKALRRSVKTAFGRPRT